MRDFPIYLESSVLAFSTESRTYLSEWDIFLHSLFECDIFSNSFLLIFLDPFMLGHALFCFRHLLTSLRSLVWTENLPLACFSYPPNHLAKHKREEKNQPFFIEFKTKLAIDLT